jgi:hypothetical protein
MLEIHRGPAQAPSKNLSLLQALMTQLARAAAMGFKPSNRTTALDPASLRRVHAALQERRVATRAPLDVATLLETHTGEQDALTTERMEAAVVRLTRGFVQPG